MVTFKEWLFLALVLAVGGTLGWGLGALGLGGWIALPVAFVFAVGWGVLTILRDRRQHPEFYEPPSISTYGCFCDEEYTARPRGSSLPGSLPAYTVETEDD